MTAALGGAEVVFDTRRLHDLAHEAVWAQRHEDGGWGHPLETALVAVADSRHPRGSQRMAEDALDWVSAWFDEEDARALGDDATAAALAARAAQLLRGGSDRFTQLACELVDSACRSQRLGVAPLHIAMSAWALDLVIPDRREPPWDAIRTAVGSFSMAGINSALVDFSRALADQSPSSISTRLIDAVPLDRTEECLLLWLVDSAVGVEIERGRKPDELEPFLRRRTELLDTLASQLGPTTDIRPSYDDFNPFDDAEVLERETLGLFEAILIDLVLSGDMPSTALVSLDEMGRLQRHAAVGRHRTYAAVAAVGTLLLTGMALAICILADAASRLTAGVAIRVASFGLGASLLFVRDEETKWNLTAVTTGLWLQLVIGAFFIIEGVRDKVVVDDEVAAVIGLIGLVAPLLVQSVVERLRKK